MTHSLHTRSGEWPLVRWGGLCLGHSRMENSEKIIISVKADWEPQSLRFVVSSVTNMRHAFTVHTCIDQTCWNKQQTG